MHEGQIAYVVTFGSLTRRRSGSAFDCVRAYQQTIFQQGQPAAMFYTDDVQGDYERIKTRGAEFTMPPTDVTASTIAMLNDSCGNLIQLTQLARK
jgi:predicted enzyme related to lactoylglutathione lyase